MDITQELILADMATCKPATTLSREWREGCWLLVDYETEDGLIGIMALADPELKAAPLELPLPAKGMCNIYLGINYTKSRYSNAPNRIPTGPYGQLEVKLSGDAGFHRVGIEGSTTSPTPGRIGKGKTIARTIHEVFWKAADITGQSLFFRPPGEPYDCFDWRSISNLSYVRLVSLSPAEERSWQALRPRPDTRRVGFIFCTGALSGHIDGGADYHPTDLDWFRTEIQPCLGSDIGLFIVEAIRGNLCTFHTRIGDVGGSDNRWRDEWVDPLAAFTRLAHENGIKIHAGLRQIGLQYPAGQHPIEWANFFRQHPEWVKLDRAGRPTTGLSLAYDGVRQRWLALLREALEYGIDGVTIYLHRFMPFVLYEQPVVAAFMEKHGVDPRELPDDNPRWLEHTAGYVTAFLHEVRQLLDEKPGRELGIGFHGTPAGGDQKPGWTPLRYQCDVAAWIRDSLADYLFPVRGAGPELVRQIVQMGSGRAQVWPALEVSDPSGEEYARWAQMYYEAGATGVVIRDAERQAQRLSEWAVVKRLGHREALDRLIAEAPSYYRRRAIQYLMGYNTRYSFNNFGV